MVEVTNTALSLTTITLLIPLVGLFVLLFMDEGKNKDAIKWTAFGFSVLAFLFSLVMWVNFDPGRSGLQMEQANLWLDLQLGEGHNITSYFYVGVDGLSLLLLLLTTFIMPLAIMSSFGSHVFEERGREKLYYIFMLLLEFAMIGVFVTHDLIVFYIFWEVTLVPMYFLIGIWGAERRIYAAIKFFLYTMAGSILMLIALLYVANTTGTFSTYDVARVEVVDEVENTVFEQGIISQVQNYQSNSEIPNDSFWNSESALADYEQALADAEESGQEPAAPPFTFTPESLLFLGFLVAFAIKVPIWPLHSWLPDAHVQAPTAGSVILAGILLKMGTYGIVRFCLPLFPDASVAWAPFVATLGVIGIIYGAWVSYAQKDVKKLVAYSSVSHLGFVVVGIFALNAQGLQGATLQMVNHGISTGGLFLMVGMLYERYHTKDMAAYGGVWKLMPVFGSISLVIVLSSMGLPGLNSFVGEFTILLGSLDSQYLGFFITLFATIGVILAAVYMLYMFQRVYMGEARTTPHGEGVFNLRWNEIAVLIPILVMVFWIGIQPAIFFNMIDTSVNNIVVQFADPNAFAFVPQTLLMLVP